ncbi:hypothetical protein MCEMRE196_01231 [Candidatus Nanopelagicaceae bacterium]
MALALLPTFAISHPAPAQAAALMRSVLSTAGQSSYDAAVSGGYFNVTKSDYDAAFNNLTSVVKVGMTDSQVAECSAAFSGTFINVVDSATAIPANSYIVGFASGLISTGSNQSLRLVISSTYKGVYDFLTSATAPVNVTTSGAKYFLFKQPVTSSTKRFVGIWSSDNTCKGSGTFPEGGYAGPSSTSPWGTFTSRTSDLTRLQVMYSSEDQWTPAPPTISSSLTGNAKTVFKGKSIAITTTLSDDGLVTFKYNNKNIGGCVSVRSASLSATCSWKPSVQGSGRITATLRSPTGAFTSVTSSPLLVSVNKRSNNR